MDSVLGVLYQFAPIIVACLLAFLGVWLKRLKAYMEEKLSLETATLVNTLIDIQAHKAVGFAEEWSRKKAKQGHDKASGNEKLSVATDFVLTQLKAHGFEDWAEGKSADVAQLIEAKLFERREEVESKRLPSV